MPGPSRAAGSHSPKTDQSQEIRRPPNHPAVSPPSREFFGQGWMKLEKNERTPYIMKTTKHFNDVSAGTRLSPGGGSEQHPRGDGQRTHLPRPLPPLLLARAWLWLCLSLSFSPCQRSLTLGGHWEGDPRMPSGAAALSSFLGKRWGTGMRTPCNASRVPTSSCHRKQAHLAGKRQLPSDTHITQEPLQLLEGGPGVRLLEGVL